MIIHLKGLIPALVAAVILVSCDTIGEDTPVPRGVVVANQGNFGDGNGSVSAYDPVSGEVRATAIASIGTIIQSLTFHDEKLYVMANTGGRVDVFDAASFAIRAQIEDVVSPRYMLTDESIGYVSNLYAAEGTVTGGLVTVLDLSSDTKIAEIEVGDHPEGLALVGTRLFVANNGFGEGTTISVVDVTTHEVIETIDVECDGPRFLAADEDDDVFVFCTGKTIFDDDFNIIGETDGAVRVLDGETGEITTRIPIDGRLGTAGPGQDAFLSMKDRAAFVVKDERSVLVFDTEMNILEEELGPFGSQPISAVAFDERSNRLYLGRSNGFTQAGEVSIHDRSGTELDRFTAGVLPAHIAFTASNAGTK